MTRHNLIELFSKVKKSGDEVLDFVRLDFAIRGLNTNLVKEVTIQPLPLSLTDHLQERAAFKACYANTFEALKKLKGNGCKYVLGYGSYGGAFYDNCFSRWQLNHEAGRTLRDIDLVFSYIDGGRAYPRHWRPGFTVVMFVV